MMEDCILEAGRAHFRKELKMDLEYKIIQEIIFIKDSLKMEKEMEKDIIKNTLI